MKSTKELARKLGLLRKRSVTSQQDRDVRKAGRTCQVFAYLIVIDFESTCWKDKKNVGQEVIEFPAVLLNTSNGEVESEFHTYVLPEENPVLSDFCTEFTGITQAQVEAGAPLSVCLSQFTRWLRKLEAEKCIAYNATQDVGKKLCTFVTWSDWDLAICLHYECIRKQLVKPSALTSWIDLRATYKNFYQRKPQGLHGALQDVGIEFAGRQHSGLDDSRNTAQLAWRMVCDGCVMKITRTMQKDVRKRPPAPAPKTTTSNQASNQARTQSTLLKHVNPSSITHSAKLIQSKLDSKVVLIAPVSYQPELAPESSTTYDHDVRPNEDMYGIPTETQDLPSRDLGGDQPKLAQKPSSTYDHDIRPNYEDTYGIPTETLDLPSRDLAEDDCDDFMTATQAIAYQDRWGQQTVADTNAEQIESKVKPTLRHISGNTPDAKSIVTVKTCLGAVTSERTPELNAKRLGLKRSSPVGDEHRAWQSGGKRDMQSAAQNKQSPPMWTTCSRLSEFKTPVGPAPVTKKSPNGTFKTPPNSTHHVLRTPTSNVTPEMMGGKITPPMCGCGRRAKKNNVVSPGPNQGRGFYSCPNRKGCGRSSESALGDSTNTRRRTKQGCGYFKWESVVIREKLALSGTPLSYKPVYNTPSPALGYKPTPSPVGKLGQSYITSGVKGGLGLGTRRLGPTPSPVCKLGNSFINSGVKGGLGLGTRRLGMSQRTVLKPPSLT